MDIAKIKLGVDLEFLEGGLARRSLGEVGIGLAGAEAVASGMRQLRSIAALRGAARTRVQRHPTRLALNRILHTPCAQLRVAQLPPSPPA